MSIATFLHLTENPDYLIMRNRISFGKFDGNERFSVKPILWGIFQMKFGFSMLSVG